MKRNSLNILLIEDNLGDIRLTKEALKETNLSINLSTVIDGSEAMNYLLKTKEYENAATPDLIFLDLNLPKKNGREVLKDIKTNAKLQSIPVVVLSTSNAEKDIQECQQLQADQFINKPVDFDEFFKTIKNVIECWFDSPKPTTVSE